MYLNCHTYYSLRYGTLSPQQLVERAARWGVTALALTDINNTSCTVEFINECRQAGVKPIAGIDFRDAEGRQLYVGLARNERGWRELNELLTRCSLEGRPLPVVAPPLPNTWIIYPRLLRPITQFRENELLGIRPEHVARLFAHELSRHQHKLVVLNPVTFPDDEGYEIHRLLRAIDRNVVLSKLTPRDLAKKNDRLLPPETLATFYRSYPRILHNTQRIIDSCSITLETGLQINRQTFTGSKDGDFALLEKLAANGCRQRYGEHHKKAAERTARELRVIREQDFCSYFLITWDIVRYAQASGYHHVGRGSGANSIVAYALGITDVDPLELDLYFERFINPYRSSPPDFDIDFSWDERDDVTDYIFKRYGREHTALLATYSTFQGRAIVRELGKVFGLPKAEIDRIIDHPADTEDHHELARRILHYGQQMEGFPNHLSIHAGGIVISEQPLASHTALQLMPKGFPVTHFDMYHAEDLGFHKFDVLSQRGLGHIKDAVNLVRRNQGRAVDIHDVPRIMNDERVRAQLRSAHCIGCFYIESPAMRGLLTKLRCDSYVHLVAASSIIRPGVARSGMMREYIRRFHAPYSFDYLHPVFEKQLGETFGVMVYQEDVMKIVHHFAGLDLDESDVLRRIMSGKKYKGDTFEKLRQKYFDNCRARGYPEELTQEVWRQIESFSGYSFCKAHSASFAVESFQSLYLKAYFPLEFMVAVINNFGGFYRTEYYVHELRQAGASVHAPCVNHSHYLTSISGTDVYLGFIHLQGLERNAARRIISERNRGGNYRSLADLVSRTGLSAEPLEILIRIGAFRFTGHNKYELMWEKAALLDPGDRGHGTLPLFRENGHIRSWTVISPFAPPRSPDRGEQNEREENGQGWSGTVISPLAPPRSPDRGEQEEGEENGQGWSGTVISPFAPPRSPDRGEQEEGEENGQERSGTVRNGQEDKLEGSEEERTSDSSGQDPDNSLTFKGVENKEPKTKNTPEGDTFLPVDLRHQLSTPSSPHEAAFDEIELLGFPLCSPFDLLDRDDCYDCIRASELPNYLGRIVSILGYYVCQKPVRTVRGDLMAFGTWLDRDGIYFDTTHFPNFLKHNPFRGRGIYRIKGKVVVEYGYYSLEVTGMEKLPYVKDGRY